MSRLFILLLFANSHTLLLLLMKPRAFNSSEEPSNLMQIHHIHTIRHKNISKCILDDASPHFSSKHLVPMPMNSSLHLQIPNHHVHSHCISSVAGNSQVQIFPCHCTLNRLSPEKSTGSGTEITNSEEKKTFTSISYTSKLQQIQLVKSD